MRRFVLICTFLVTIAVVWVTIASLIRRHFAVDPEIVVAPPTTGPELERATDTAAIVRWTSANPGGTALHYGIVRYGTSAVSLTRVAKSPNRRNPSNPAMIFRVQVAGLDAHTTYYYTVESVGATGVSDGASSPVTTFQTR